MPFGVFAIVAGGLLALVAALDLSGMVTVLRGMLKKR
jgi:hypothetical protein